jgi:hypothetical protein
VRLLAEGAVDSENEGDAIDTGSEIVKIDRMDLDKTDRQNLRFIYPL